MTTAATKECAVDDEQAAFELERKSFGLDFTRWGSTKAYESDRTNAAFSAWKARAAIAKATVPA